MSEATTVTAQSAVSLETRLAQFPAQQVVTAQRIVSYREAGGANTEALPLVLLHGIGSGAASGSSQETGAAHHGATAHHTGGLAVKKVHHARPRPHRGHRP